MSRKKYNREDVFIKSLEYFKGDELAANVWINKYALKDSEGNIYEETPDDMHHRIASEIARIEKKYPNPISEDDIYDSIKKFKYIVPQGGSMSGIGNNEQTVSLSNCFVIGNEHDSYGSVMKTDEEQVQLMKRRGGIGHDLSHIRPKNSPVKNSALTSTGLVPFMERYSNSTREVGQDGRRGALMLSCDIKHPNSEDFMDAKMTQGKVTGANISLKLSDDFMKAVIDNNVFTQQYPVNSLNPTIMNEVLAKPLFDKIVHNAWSSAEPGILLWDTVIKESIPDCYSDFGFKTVSTNPCFSGKEKLLTIDGNRTFEELCGLTNIKIINSVGHVVPTKVWCSGKKETINVYDSQSNIMTCTPDHVWKTINDGEVQAKDLKGKQLLPYLNQKNTNKDELYVKLGFIQGDGNLGRLKSTAHNGFEINIGKNDDDVLNYFNLKRTDKNYRKFYVTEYYDICKTLEFNCESLPERTLPLSIYAWSDKNKLSFLSGLYSANGSIVGNYRIALKSTCKQLILEVQKLLKEFDIDSYYTTNKSKTVTFSNGDYVCKESYDLNIGKYYDLIKFYSKIGFIHQYKNIKLFDVITTRSPKITKIINNGVIDVYDFIEPETNWGVVNDCISHNCGEIPLCPYDSCRLIAMNLYSYVIDPFTKNAKFDYDLFDKHAYLSQRYMDDIIDLELEKIDQILCKIESDPEDEDIKKVEKDLWLKIKEKAINGRRTGIGITSEGDMLAALGYTYGTKDATDFSINIHKKMAISVYKASCLLSQERGSFPIFNAELEKNNPLILRLSKADPELANLLKIGRRNIALLTLAPVGTVSIMTQTTSGIEPVFLVSYKRRRKINPNDKDTRVDFVDEVGDSWEEYNVFHPKFLKWLNVNEYDANEVKLYSDEMLKPIIEKSPYHNATSNDVDWVEKVKMQGGIQKWIDHSISVTVNLPNNATEEVVSNVYIEAWKSGCKGVTVYRDGSRSGVLISNDKKEEKKADVIISENSAPKRPKSLKCDILRFQNNKEKWIGFVGTLEDRPYEIFTGALDSFQIPSFVEEGWIRKVKDTKINDEGQEVKTSRYDFIYFDKDGYEQEMRGLNRAFNREYWNYGKLMSGILRHGMPIPNAINLVDSLSLGDTVVSWKSGVKRMLKRYIKDGEDVKGAVCPECGLHTLKYESGCSSCTNCGYSKCG